MTKRNVYYIPYSLSDDSEINYVKVSNRHLGKAVTLAHKLIHRMHPGVGHTIHMSRVVTY